MVQEPLDHSFPYVYASKVHWMLIFRNVLTCLKAGRPTDQTDPGERAHQTKIPTQQMCYV